LARAGKGRTGNQGARHRETDELPRKVFHACNLRLPPVYTREQAYRRFVYRRILTIRCGVQQEGFLRFRRAGHAAGRVPSPPSNLVGLAFLTGPARASKVEVAL